MRDAVEDKVRVIVGEARRVESRSLSEGVSRRFPIISRPIGTFTLLARDVKSSGCERFELGAQRSSVSSTTMPQVRRESTRRDDDEPR